MVATNGLVCEQNPNCVTSSNSGNCSQEQWDYCNSTYEGRYCENYAPHPNGSSIPYSGEYDCRCLQNETTGYYSVEAVCN